MAAKKQVSATKLLHELLNDDIAQSVILDFKLQDDTPEEQAEFISQLGENIMLRLTLEILKLLPESEHERFKEFIGSGDMPGLRTFLMPHILDLDRFFQHEVMKEYEATKTRMREIEQGVDV